MALAAATELIQRFAISALGRMADRTIEAIAGVLCADWPLLVCDNDGSAAAMHIAGELAGRFLKERPSLKIICLSSNTAVLIAWNNDYATAFPPSRFAQIGPQWPGLGEPVDSLVLPVSRARPWVGGVRKTCLGGSLRHLLRRAARDSTNVNSKNMVNGLHAARTAGMTTVGLTGAGGAMAELCDHLIAVPWHLRPGWPADPALHLPLYLREGHSALPVIPVRTARTGDGTVARPDGRMPAHPLHMPRRFRQEL
ncbi:D-sedoheptulose 7-phosphate isomerase [Azospirillum brasilense]|nr:D-sedoheptulose 7-phosphate isomerase [Azospirillum brasilense]